MDSKDRNLLKRCSIFSSKKVLLYPLFRLLIFFAKKVGENGGKWGKMCNFEAEFEKTGKACSYWAT